MPYKKNKGRLASFHEHPSNLRIVRDEPPVVEFTDWEKKQIVFAKCWVAIAEMDYDLRKWSEELARENSSSN